MSIETHLISLRTYLEDIANTQRKILRLLEQPQSAPVRTSAVLSVEGEPWAGYDAMNIAEVLVVMQSIDQMARAKVLAYERAHKNRTGIVTPLYNWDN